MKKMLGNLLFVLLCLVAFAAVAFTAGRASFYRTLATSRTAYKTDWNGVTLTDNEIDLDRQVGYDLYLPTEKEAKSDTLILYIHGGGFTSGDRRTAKWSAVIILQRVMSVPLSTTPCRKTERLRISI